MIDLEVGFVGASNDGSPRIFVHLIGAGLRKRKACDSFVVFPGDSVSMTTNTLFEDSIGRGLQFLGELLFLQGGRVVFHVSYEVVFRVACINRGLLLRSETGLVGIDGLNELDRIALCLFLLEAVFVVRAFLLGRSRVPFGAYKKLPQIGEMFVVAVQDLFLDPVTRVPLAQNVENARELLCFGTCE